MPRRRVLNLTALAVSLLLVLFWLALTPNAIAAPPYQEVTPTPQPDNASAQEATLQLSISDDVCLGCHGNPGQTITLDNGEILDLYVAPTDHQRSVHGLLGYACVQCHTRVGNYPHPAFQAASFRDASLKLYQACKRCHAHQYELAQDSVHATAFNAGNDQAAICTDCHTAHAVQRLIDPKTHQLTAAARVWIPQTCERCHSLIYEKYKQSVHGSALIGEGNADVPTCIDCHGVHNIQNPTTAKFRLMSPQICAKCHTDPKIMNKYGISTEVLNTYVSDFHGTTVVLFEKESPDAVTNKPVCYDCHGVHDIVRANDPQKGLQVRNNLLVRCQACHPDATASFPTAWLSHYIPSVDKNPMVYYVNLFYKFLIPGILGGMGILVVMDFSRMTINRVARRKKIAHERAAAETLIKTVDEPTTADQPIDASAPVEPANHAEVEEVETPTSIPTPNTNPEVNND